MNVVFSRGSPAKMRMRSARGREARGCVGCKLDVRIADYGAREHRGEVIRHATEVAVTRRREAEFMVDATKRRRSATR